MGVRRQEAAPRHSQRWFERRRQWTFIAMASSAKAIIAHLALSLQLSGLLPLPVRERPVPNHVD
jgi:hypothetical protein